ncbi:cytochrome b-c1 complex subunit 2, mitochondrial-like [Amphiura filiformis]|uniref:cytochrome b-c1 complex subunit 2, mitochondrial-like n=1 Tax=Amphiura filiformis TaxID=82378 RepID=UPI003B21F716
MMSVSGIRPLFAGVSRRWLSAQAAAQATRETQPLPKQDAQVSKLGSGLTVASLENYSPISRIGVVVNAGPRHETTDNLGISHCLRSFADLSTKHATGFAITRGLEDVAASLETSTTREHQIYTVRCMRDAVDTGVHYLNTITNGQEFRRWELRENKGRLTFDLATIKDQLPLRVMDDVHSAAFRETLGRSAYAPEYMIGNHSTDMLLEYVQQHYTAGNMALVGVGVDHSELTKLAEQFEARTGSGAVKQAATFTGGAELRNQCGGDFSLAAVAVEGCASGSKDALALGILQHMMGAGPYIKWGSNQAASKLTQGAGKATSLPFSASCFNLAYSDAGAFGVFAVANAEDMDGVLKGMMKEFGAVTKGNISSKDFERAKNQFKAAVLMNSENQDTLFEDLAVQALNLGSYSSPADLAQQIDSITADDTLKLAKKVFNGKPCMAASGNLGQTPYMDQLM